MKKLGERLRQRAKELGMTSAEVARGIGVSEQRYGNYVANLREPDLDTFLRIAKALRTTPNALLGLEDAKCSDPKRERLLAAAGALPSDAIDVVVVQLEALARPRKARSAKAPR